MKLEKWVLKIVGNFFVVVWDKSSNEYCKDRPHNLQFAISQCRCIRHELTHVQFRNYFFVQKDV